MFVKFALFFVYIPAPTYSELLSDLSGASLEVLQIDPSFLQHLLEFEDMGHEGYAVAHSTLIKARRTGRARVVGEMIQWELIGFPSFSISVSRCFLGASATLMAIERSFDGH